jgi:hypothetical protein
MRRPMRCRGAHQGFRVTTFEAPSAVTSSSLVGVVPRFKFSPSLAFSDSDYRDRDSASFSRRPPSPFRAQGMLLPPASGE